MTTINFKKASSRYFENPFHGSSTAVSAHVTDEWLRGKITTLASRICSRPVSEEEMEKGPYTGLSGVGYALLRANDAIGGRAEQNYADYVLGVMNQISQRELSSRRLGRYLTGSIGDYVVRTICLHKLGYKTDAFVTKLKKEAVEILEDGNENEILNGRAGYLAGVLTLKTEIGIDLLSDAEITKVLNAIIASGRKYSSKHKSAAPLMFEWHHKEYLGAAHGLSGILQILLTYWRLLDETQRAAVKQTVDWFVGTQDRIGNFPSSSEDIGDEEQLVHWCHGATGVLHMLICAIQTFKEDRYMKSAQRCAQLIWERGILRKGPGICHGVAGSGYALLLLYRLTKRPEFLQQAKAFAYIMMDPGFEKAARTPDMPWSLYEGWSGALCFLADLLKPEKAQLPLVPIPIAFA